MVGQLNLSLVPSDHNEYNISCFGYKDGAIDLTVTGGTPPYQYEWSSGATTQDVANLPAGYVAVLVTDALGANTREEITLTEPGGIKAELLPFEYGNGYNISLFNAYNGSINLTTFGGVAPYTYAWYDGPTTEDSTALGSDNFGVHITDANGCYIKTDAIYLRQPDRSDWTNSGNAGTNPATNYIGTSDNKDVVFKSNGVEGLRLLSDGNIKAAGLASGSCQPLYITSDGLLKRADAPDFPVCTTLPWYLGGNQNVDVTNNRIGTNVPVDLRIITNALERMRITADGKVGIGENVLVTQNGQVGIGTTTALGGSLNIKRQQGDWLQLKRTAQDGSDDGAWGIHNGDPSQNHLAFHYYMPGGGALLNRLTLWNDGKVSIGEKVMVTENGNVGIGTTTSLDAPLSVKRSQGDWIRMKRTAGDGADDGVWAIHNGNGNQDHLAFHYYPPTGDALLNRLVLWNDGKVSIGNVSRPGDYDFYVENGILTKRLKVAVPGSSEWSDHVFKPGYRLLPLPEVAEYIGRNGHLPGVPSADCMVEDGLDVAKTDAMLMEKVEELTLHAIDLNKRLERAEQIIRELVLRLSQTKE